MKLRQLTYWCVATASLAACERYTEQSSPCFGRNGEPIVARASLSLLSPSSEASGATKDCVFDKLPGPE